MWSLSFKKIDLKMPSAKWWPYSLNLNVLINPFHKSHRAPFCNRNVHISATKWCIVGYGTGALWDLLIRSIVATVLIFSLAYHQHGSCAAFWWNDTHHHNAHSQKSEIFHTKFCINKCTNFSLINNNSLEPIVSMATFTSISSAPSSTSESWLS